MIPKQSRSDWVHLGPSGSVLVRLGPSGSIRVHLGLFRFVRACLGPSGFDLVRPGPSGSKEPLGTTWNPIEPLGTQRNPIAPNVPHWSPSQNTMNISPNFTKGPKWKMSDEKAKLRNLEVAKSSWRPNIFFMIQTNTKSYLMVT